VRSIIFLQEQFMEKLAILALLDAKPGKEAEVEAFLKSALPMAQAEAGTVSWYALKLSPSRSVGPRCSSFRRHCEGLVRQG
jgi:hypothetical protein